MFKKGIQEKHADFRKGLSEYLLTKFYLKKKQEFEGQKMPEDLSVKIKATFDVINEQ
jgi:hypothetical protein